MLISGLGRIVNSVIGTAGMWDDCVGTLTCLAGIFDISAAEWPRIHTWGVALKIIGTVPKAWLFSKLIRGAFMYCHLIRCGTGYTEDIF